MQMSPRLANPRSGAVLELYKIGRAPLASHTERALDLIPRPTLGVGLDACDPAQSLPVPKTF